jgi:RimJ/RimL family protein N-acetyltransferase
MGMESEHLKLEILTPGRIPDLFQSVGSDPEIYQWLRFRVPNSYAEFEPVISGYIAEGAKGIREIYGVILKESDLAIGTTSFLDLNPENHSLEIGSTFYAKKYWRTFVNSECKLLMLTEAFENREIERVTIKTDALNERSRTAILRLGATFEGVLRHHMLRPDGTWRDSAYFSILAEEWPHIKGQLQSKLNSH